MFGTIEQHLDFTSILSLLKLLFSSIAKDYT